jgi:FkbM family methyltransferase
VLAVEPQARLWPVILRNLQLNDCANVALLPFAVGESRSEFEMTLFPSTNTGATSLVGGVRSRFASRQPVTVLPTCGLLEGQGVPVVDVLKVDVEGYELFALRGLGAWLDPRRVRHLLVELHPAQLRALGQSVDQLHALLEAAGYRLAHAGGEEHWTAA